MRNGVSKKCLYLALPPEIHSLIFYALPNMETAVNLRLTCRYFESIYQNIKTRVLVIQRTRLTAPFAALYDLLGRLTLPDWGVQRPPPDGWPNFRPGVIQKWDKTPFALNVMRHLPYIRSQVRSSVRVTEIDTETRVIDYSDPKWSQPQAIQDEEELGANTVPWYPGGIPVTEKRHGIFVAVASGDEGTPIFLNTFTGLLQMPGSEDDAEENTSRFVTVTPQEYCDARIATLSRLDQVFIPGFHPITVREREEGEVYSDDDEEKEMELDKAMAPNDFRLSDGFDPRYLRFLHRKFGWPGESYDKEACVEHLQEYMTYWAINDAIARTLDEI